jgi:hypothetical protein
MLSTTITQPIQATIPPLPCGTSELTGPPAVLTSEFRAEPPVDLSVVLLRITFTCDRWKKQLTNGVQVRTAGYVEAMLNHELRW